MVGSMWVLMWGHFCPQGHVAMWGVCRGLGVLFSRSSHDTACTEPPQGGLSCPSYGPYLWQSLHLIFFTALHDTWNHLIYLGLSSSSVMRLDSVGIVLTPCVAVMSLRTGTGLYLCLYCLVSSHSHHYAECCLDIWRCLLHWTHFDSRCQHAQGAFFSLAIFKIETLSLAN